MNNTAKDVAMLAGVSPATVSRVFNKQAQVSQTIRQRVMQAAMELDYAPPSANRHHIIALLLPDSQRHPYNGYIWSCTSQLVDQIVTHGFSVEIIPTNVIHLLDQPNITGVISLVYDNDDWQGWTNPRQLPLININAHTPHLPNSITVASDAAHGMELSIGYLTQRGHKRIGMFTKGVSDAFSATQRQAAFIQVGKQLGLAASDLIIQHAITKADHYEAIGKLVRSEVTAIICPGEDSGVIAAYILNLFNCRIPENISLISQEIEQMSEYYLPQHTTLKQDFKAMAIKAIDLLKQMIEHKKTASQSLVPYAFIERESVRDLRLD
jgi:DNA-binding LacI/PurR family transcriptional regulator